MAPRRSQDERSDARLVAACLAGDEAAWVALVERYERLVWSIATADAADPSDAADLFQAIWVDVHGDLPQLRQPESFKAWLTQLAARRAYRWRRRRERRAEREVGDVDRRELEAAILLDPEFAASLERDQLVREAIARLSPRCREMIRMLFFTVPPKPYAEVAETLGLAVGSIGFIRGRCLEKLRRALEELGVE